MTRDEHEAGNTKQAAKLEFSRAYSLALSPQLIYTRSALLPTLVSSKVYRQLEFLAVGSWWMFARHDEDISKQMDSSQGQLKKIPGSREEVFGDNSIDLKTKRSLMKFLKLASDPDAQTPVLARCSDQPFDEFLMQEFGLPLALQAALHALTLSLQPPSETKTSYAIPRITRHLASIGVFGPGFGSVVPKWGGAAEIAQVACRAGAVGGGVYVLGRGVKGCEQDATSSESSLPRFKIRLQNEDKVQTSWLVGRTDDITAAEDATHGTRPAIVRSISILSSDLSTLFSEVADGSPPPAGAVVVFPVGSLRGTQASPVYIMVHSSDTGECPTGQCKLNTLHLLTCT